MTSVCSHPTWLPQVVTTEMTVEGQSDMSEGSWGSGHIRTSRARAEGSEFSIGNSEFKASLGYTVRARQKQSKRKHPREAHDPTGLCERPKHGGLQ